MTIRIVEGKTGVEVRGNSLEVLEILKLMVSRLDRWNIASMDGNATLLWESNHARN